MADIRRLMALGVPAELAKELAAQIDAAGGGTGTVAASDIAYTPSGNLTATNVQDALDELEANKQDAA